MSADNGIYVLQSLDGWRVIEAQAIDNIYWHHICCNYPSIVQYEGTDGCYHEKCISCKTTDPKGEIKSEINPNILKDYFGKSKVFKTQEEAMNEASKLYHEIMNDDYCPICEYGICFINGWENKEFPK